MKDFLMFFLFVGFFDLLYGILWTCDLVKPQPSLWSAVDLFIKFYLLMWAVWHLAKVT